MIELVGANKHYGDLVALHPTTLRIEDARTTVLVGPSGCGKSTVLRLVSGLVPPDDGEVRVGGAPLSKGRAREQRRAMGYVIQEGGLFPHLTAERNVTLVAQYGGLGQEATRARVRELAELVHLSPERLARHPHDLSGGERQRVSLMRALVLDPPLLLLDEPLGALDPITRRALQDDLRALFQKLRKTVVLVTHDMAEAAYLGDVLVLMRAGGVVQCGTFADLRDHPQDPYVTQFLQAQRAVPS